MKRSKRPLSLLLTLAMLLGCLYIPAVAENEQYELGILNMQKAAGTSYDENADSVTGADPGDVIVLTVGVKNKSAASVSVNSFNVSLKYGDGVLPVTSADGMSSPFNRNPYAYNTELRNDYEWSFTGNANESGIVYIGGYCSASNVYEIPAGGQLELFKLAFKVQDGASGTVNFTMPASENNQVSTTDGKLDAAFAESSLTIGGDTPSGGLTVTPDAEEIYVPGDGEDEKTMSVAVQPAGTSVVWTVSPAVNGVRMGAKDNMLHVTSDAKSTATKDGYPVKITATAGDMTGSATVLVKLAPSTYTLTLSPNRAKVGTETTVSASLADQYGAYSDDFEVSVKPQGDGTADWNVGNYSTGTHAYSITVPADAVEGTYTVTARTGSGESASADLIVSESAAARPYLVVVSPSQASAVVPDQNSQDATAQFSAVVQDSSFTPMDSVAVQWGIKNGAPRGISVDNNGLVTISRDAKDTVSAQGITKLTVTATTIDPDLGTTTAASISGEALLTLTRAASVIKTLKLNPDKVTVQFGQETRVQPVVTDQYGDAVSGVTLTVSPMNQGVSVSNGLIVVSGNASPDDYSITASYGEGENAVTVGPETLSVTRESSLPASIQITPAQRDVTIPSDPVEGMEARDETASFTALVRDQFGTEMKDQYVFWQIDKMEGVSIDAQTGLVTVSNAAKNSVSGTEGTKLTVTAISTVNQGVYATADLWIRRSAPVYSRIRILSGGNEIIKTDTVGIPSSKSYTTQILDQYGNPVAGLNASLELANAPASVRLNGTVLEVPDDGSIRDGASAILRATYGVLSTQVTVVFRTVEVQWIDADDITYGDPKSAAFYGVPGPATAYQSDGSPINGTFSVLDPDVVLTAGENRTVTLRFSASLNGTELNVDRTYTINVLKRPLSIPTQEALTLEYSGQTSFRVDGVQPVGLTAGDEFTYTISGTMEKRAGEQRAKITGLSLEDESKAGVEANYQRPDSMGDMLVNVTKRPVEVYNVRPVSSTIPYDQADKVELTGGSLRNVVPGDDVSIELGIGTVEGDVLGENRPVTTHITLIGADADSYELTQPANVYVTVQKAAGVEIEASDEPAVSPEDIPEGQTELAALDYAQTGVQEFQDLGSGDASAEDDPTPYVYKDVYQQVEKLHPDGEVTAEVIVRVKPETFSLSAGMALDVSLSFQVYKRGTTEKVGGETELHSLTRPVTVAVNIPTGFNARYAAHTLDNGTTEYMKVTLTSDSKAAFWKQKAFSPVTLLPDQPTLDTAKEWEATKPDGSTETVTNPQAALEEGWIVRPVSSQPEPGGEDPKPGEEDPKPADTVVITFLKSDGVTKDAFSGDNPRTFTAAGAALPTGTETGFQGWEFPDDSTVYTSLTTALWNQYKNKAVTATASVKSETPANSVTIRFMKQDGTPDSSLGSQNYTAAGAALPKPAAVEGYTFQHWTITGISGGVNAVTQEVWTKGLAATEKTLDAVPVFTKDNTDADKGTITFLTTSGAVNTSLPGTQSGVLEVASGNVTLPAMSSYSDASYIYTFQGWLLGNATTPVMVLTEAAWNSLKGSGAVARPYFIQTPINSGSSGGGGGGGGGSSRSSSRSSSSTTHSVSCTSDINGTVSASPTSASSGTTVTVTLTPNSGFELDKLTVKNQNGNNIGTTAKGGQYTFIMPSSNVTVNATFKKSASAPVNPDNGQTNPVNPNNNNQPNPVDSEDNNGPTPTPAGSSPFTDIAPGHPFYNAILWAAQNGITTGTTPATFSPDMSCTRAQAMTFFWRAAGQPEPLSAQNPFTDITPDAYYYKAVLWAVEQEITNGTTAATFSPNNTVTRGQIVTFLHRWSGTPLGARDNPFKDVWRAPDVYFYDAVLWAVEQSITNGTSPTTFEPTLKCTRGQIVTFLYRYMVQ